MLLLLLLRQETLPAIEGFLSAYPAGSFVSRENGLGPTERASELLREAVRHGRYRSEDWRLCGRRRAGFGHVPFVSNDILGIADTYEWCLVPWGTEGTGLMVAVVSSDDHVISQAKEILSKKQCVELTVSHYTRAEVENRRFKGAVFNRGLGVQGEGVWERNSCPTAFVLTAEGGELPTRRTPEAAEIVDEDVEIDSLGIPVKRQWICISAGAALLHYATFPYTTMVAAGDADDHIFDDLVADCKKNGWDPLPFGLAALRSASWIYVPVMVRGLDEIYINRNPQETAKLVADERIASAPQSILICYC